MFEAGSGILLTATGWNGRLVQQVGQLVHCQAVRWAARSARSRAWPPSWSGWGSAGIGNHLSFGLGSAGALDLAGPVTLAALLAIGLAAVGALGAAGDRPGPRAGLGGVAFAVQLHHHPSAQGRVVLGTPHPLGQLPTRPGPDRELTVVERHKYRVQLTRGRLPTALAGRVDGALAHGLEVADRHAEAMALEGFGQRWPGGAELGRGGVDAAQPLGQRVGPFGFAAGR
jgi:hypothetical protein